MALLQEIQAKCSPEQIAAGDYHDIAATVNVGRKRTVSTTITERGVRGALGPVLGSKFLRLLTDLNVAAAADQVPAWLTAVLTALHVPSDDHIYYLETLGCGIDWLRSDGLDLGDMAVRGLLDIIAGGNPSLAPATAILKGKAEQPALVSWNECATALGA